MSKGLLNEMMLKSILENADSKEILTALIDEGIISKSDVAEYYNGEIEPFLRRPKLSHEGYVDFRRFRLWGVEKFDIRDLTESGEALIFEDAEGIGDRAFENCSQVTKVVVPKGVKVICHFAFNNCPNLETVVLPKGLKYIQDGAFANCPKLTNINIPSLYVKIGENVFLNTPVGEKFMQQLEERRPQSYKGAGITKPMYSYIIDRKLVQFDERDLDENGEFVVPSQVVKIENEAFRECKKLIKVKFLPGLQEIGSYSFFMCTNLQEVKMSNSITKIGSGAFKGCSDLKEIILPKGLECIEDYTFEDCGLERVVLPKGLKGIRNSAFCNCTYLKDINVPDSLLYIHHCSFYGSGFNYNKLLKEKRKCECGYSLY